MLRLPVSRTDFDHAPDPASALAAIEAETGDVNAGSSKDALKRLRQLLEREIEAQVCTFGKELSSRDSRFASSDLNAELLNGCPAAAAAPAKQKAED